MPSTAPVRVSSASASISLARPKSVTRGRTPGSSGSLEDGDRLHQDISRLEVAVDDAPGVGMPDGLGDAARDPRRGTGIERPLRGPSARPRGSARRNSPRRCSRRHRPHRSRGRPRCPDDRAGPGRGPRGGTAAASRARRAAPAGGS